MADLGALLRAKYDDYLSRRAEELYQMAYEEAPYKTGFLRENIIVRKNRDSNYSVVSTASYTKLVHEGHAVRGEKKGDTAEALRQGESVKQVPANPFLQRAADGMKR